MYRPPEEATRLLQSPQHVGTADAGWRQIDGPTAALFKRRITKGFKKQLEYGVPSNEAERALRQLAEQLRSGKVRIKAFLRYPLHAKLYLVYRNDPVTPLIGFVGSSNLTLAGLSQQGELNVDVVSLHIHERISTCTSLELRRDYEDFLQQRGLPLWPRDDPRRQPQGAGHGG